MLLMAMFPPFITRGCNEPSEPATRSGRLWLVRYKAPLVRFGGSTHSWAHRQRELACLTHANGCAERPHKKTVEFLEGQFAQQRSYLDAALLALVTLLLLPRSMELSASRSRSCCSSSAIRNATSML